MNPNPIDLQTLSRLLDQAMDLEVEQLDGWLAGLGEEHSHLIPQLREMLVQHRSQDQAEFMADGPRLADDTVARHGDLVGPYRLIREIGRGGMGTVWLAERADGSLKRQVALKLPRLAWGAGLAERMARERDIGALLEHPNIARLYDAGVDAKGRPYLAFEHIAGRDIDSYCDSHGLGVPERLRLFVQVARAVAYAHGRLVVHRDLKPSNVLVADDGQAHLLDFGIAKLLHEAADATQLTQEQGRVLTPQYASPEQVRGETITVVSDVFSLGVLLYQLLSGSLPYHVRRQTLGAIEEAILEGEPPLASSRAVEKMRTKALRGELDAILTKALRREPAQRYQTVDALADDIERHLNGEMVTAQPDSTVYRLRKAVRRHWVVMSASAAIVGAMSTGGALALIQAQRAAEQAERSRLSTQFIAEIFRATTKPSPAGPATAATMLDQGARLIQTRFPNRPDMQADLFGFVGQAYADLGANTAALEMARRELTLLDTMAAAPDRRARALMRLARVSMDEFLDEDAERNATAALHALSVGDEAWADARVLLARVQERRGKLMPARDAVQQLERALPAAGRAQSAAMAWAIWLKGDLVGDSVAKTALRRQALDVALAVSGPGSTDVVEMQLALDHWLTALNRPAEADPYRDAALASLRALGGASAVRASLQAVDSASFRCGMGVLSHADALAAIARERQAVAALAMALPPIVVARMDSLQAECELKWGALDEAARLYTASVPALLDGSQSLQRRFDVATISGWLASLRGEHEQADIWLRERLRLHGEMGDSEAGFVAIAWAFVATNEVMRGDLAAARKVLAQAPQFQAVSADAVSGSAYVRVLPEVAARVELEGGRPDLAKQAMPLLPPQETDTQTTFPEYALRGEIDCARGSREEGLATLLESILSISQRVSPNDAGLARIRAVAGLCALAMGRRHEATELASAARRALAAHTLVSPWFARSMNELDRRLAAR